MSMNSGVSNSFAAISQHKKAGILATALVAVGAFGGWGISATFVKNAEAVESVRQEAEEAKLDARPDKGRSRRFLHGDRHRP